MSSIKGGSLRNVPIGGSCWKNHRSKSVKVPSRDRSSLNAYSPDSTELSESSNGDSGSGSQSGSGISSNTYSAQQNGSLTITNSESQQCLNLLRDDQDKGEELVFWSDTAAAKAIPSFARQPTAHNLQELENFTSMNLSNDIWNSFDFSGLEIFSRS
ncbi:hypothetical protein PanWU01x14_022860 [Parasponia andersonii]|uniref:Uncharacterized protein n=1 Tax=Parasponia andersonii TaxID=3476 RepID=A0A2P5DXB7_PARAD|nr:hypothetical protein PanWU01x14_022860 [Parasponia andersonii]